MVLLLVQKAITTCVTGQNKIREEKGCNCLSGTVIRAAMSPALPCMPPGKVPGVLVLKTCFPGISEVNNFLKDKLGLRETWKELMHIPRRHLLSKDLDLTAHEKEPGILEILTRNTRVGNIERMKHIKFDLVSLL